MTQYIDTVSTGTSDSFGTTSTTSGGSQRFTIGDIASIDGGEWSGSIDEVIIYNRSLSLAEIEELYNLGNIHIEWNDWDSEGTVEDLVADTSTSKGKFFQYKASFNTNTTDVSPRLLNHSISVVPDADGPVITIAYPINGTNYSTLNFNVTTINFTMTDDSDLSTCWFSDDAGATNTTINTGANCAAINYTAANPGWNGSYTWIIYANDSLDQTDRKIITFGADPFLPNATLSIPVNGINTSTVSQNLTANLSDDGLGIRNVTFFIYNLPTGELFNSTVLTFASGTFRTNAGVVITLVDGVFEWFYRIFDWAGNVFESGNQTITVDTNGPNITGIVYSPGYNTNTSDRLDPGVVIEFNATADDLLTSVSSVVVQYYNGSDWNNISTSLQGKVYNGTLTTHTYAANYTFNVYANDSLGNTNISVNQTFSSEWDCSWDVSPIALGSVAGFFEEKFIGNITVNNTGDIAYSDNNCTLTFGGDSSGTSLYTGSSGWNGDGALINFTAYYYLEQGTKGLRYYNGTGGAITSLVVNASNSGVFTVNGFFTKTSSGAFKEFPTFDLVSSVNDSVDGDVNKTITMSLVVTPGAFLEAIINESVTDSLILLSTRNVTLSSYIRNLVNADDNDKNNTARNVTLNWTLPSELSDIIRVGNLTSLFHSLNSSANTTYSNLTLRFDADTLPDFVNGTYTVDISSSGFENSSDVFRYIEHSNNETTLTNTYSIEFVCDGTGDGICVESCGSADSDCSTTTTPPPTTTPTSGGGGGGGGGATTASSKADYQLIRGKENEMIVPIKALENKTLSDLKFSVKGRIAKYIEVIPDKLGRINAGDTYNLVLRLTSPTFIELGRHEITLVIEGKKAGAGYLENRRITIEIHEISFEDAVVLVGEAEDLMDLFEKAGLESGELDLALEELQVALNDFVLETVIRNHDKIRKEVSAALDSLKMLSELDDLLEEAKAKGIDVSGSDRLLKLARLSIQRGEYETAFARAKEAQVTFALETKGEFGIGSVVYFVKTKPLEFSLGFLFVVLFGFVTYKVGRLQLIKRKIGKLNEEEDILNELIKVVQTEAFKQKKMSMDEYREAMEQYEKKISAVVENLIDLENQRIHALKFTRAGKRFGVERDRLKELIKGLQEDYLHKQNIDERIYQIKMESYTRRIGEVDSRLAEIEAEKALSRWGGKK